MEEIWKECPFAEESYRISNLGRLIVLGKTWIGGRGCVRTSVDRIVTPQLDKNGYLQATLYANKKLYRKTIHRLVITAFLPNPENKLEINHKDGCKTNNYIENLEWIDRSDNLTHAYKFDLRQRKRGSDSPRSKFTKDQVKEIILSKEGPTALGLKFGVERHTISRIRSRKSWHFQQQKE